MGTVAVLDAYLAGLKNLRPAIADMSPEQLERARGRQARPIAADPCPYPLRENGEIASPWSADDEVSPEKES